MADDGSRGRIGAGSPGRIPLLDAAPDLLSFLSSDERPLLEQLSIPAVVVPKGSFELAEVLNPRTAFAAIVVEGLVLHQVVIGAEPGLRILGPGDVIALPNHPGSAFFGSSTDRAPSSTRLALLGGDFLRAVQRAPRILVGLQAMTAAQMERLSTQLAICQLPRVADRVQAMLWLLADSFGRVTPSGTRLSLSLTHEVLGALVGARRPTVTLALGELATRGAVVPQDGGWLLLEPLEAAVADRRRTLVEPQILDQEATDWAAPVEPLWGPTDTAALTETVHRFQEQHERNVERVRESLDRVAFSRQRSSEVLRRVGAPRRLSWRPPPSP